MSEQEKSPWAELLSRLLKELSSPWDWVAAIAGGAAGSAFSVTLQGLDLGTSIATGALAAVAIRKASYTSLQGRRLRRRASGLKKAIEESISHLGDEWGSLKILVDQLEFESRL